MDNKLSFQDYRSRISIIDVAKSIGYSDRTQWAREKKSSSNPCLQNTNGDQIIISQPGNPSKQLYFNPQDSTDKGDLITFVKNKLHLDTKGINDYLRTFLNGQPLIQNTRPQWNGTGTIESPDKEFKAYYFKFSELNDDYIQYLQERGINAETINSKAFQGVFKSVQLPVFRNGKFVSHSEEFYLAVEYRERLNGETTGVDYRNRNIHKHGISSKKSTSVGISNIPAVVKNVFITESGIDAISHYQLTQPGDEVVYIITGGNLTLGQLKAIETIQTELSKTNSIKTTLLFDNDVAGSIYDLKFIAQTINHSSDEDLINIEQNKEDVIIEINTEPLPVKLCEQLISIGSHSDNTVITEPGRIKIHARKEATNLENISNSLLDLFAITEVLQLHKSPVQNDWNDAVKYVPSKKDNDQVTLQSMKHTPDEKHILNNISVLVSSFLDTVEARKREEKNRLFLYGTTEKKKKTLSTKNNLITFKEPFFWKGESFSQLIVESLKTYKTGEVAIIGFTRDTPYYKSLEELFDAVDWVKMESYHNKNYQSMIDTPVTFSVSEIADDIHNLFGTHLSSEEAGVYIDSLKNRFATELSKSTTDLLNEISKDSFALLNKELERLNARIGEKSEQYEVYQKQVLFEPEYTVHDTITNDLNKQAAKPESFSQFKNKTMSQTNAGEQTQKTASEKLEGVMKSLGLKDVWDQVSKTFQAWADGSESGRKSFSFENKTFRRTGYSDETRNISTDMIADIALNFNKNEKGVFFNSYTVELKNSIINGLKPEKRGSVKDTFEISLKKDESANNLTVKKALNLLDGRSINIGENNWIKRNGSEVVEYKFDLERAIKESKTIDFSSTKPEHMESALESLRKGDYALVGCAIDGKPVHIFLTADAQYKKIEAHDNTLYRHLSEAEKTQIQENLSHKQDQAQGAKQHP